MHYQITEKLIDRTITPPGPGFVFKLDFSKWLLSNMNRIKLMDVNQIAFISFDDLDICDEFKAKWL